MSVGKYVEGLDRCVAHLIKPTAVQCATTPVVATLHSTRDKVKRDGYAAAI
jgi:hypothetical protein